MPLGECTCSGGWQPGKTMVSRGSHTARRNICKTPQCVNMGCAGASMSAWEAGAFLRWPWCVSLLQLRKNCEPTAIRSSLLCGVCRRSGHAAQGGACHSLPVLNQLLTDYPPYCCVCPQAVLTCCPRTHNSLAQALSPASNIEHTAY